MAMRILLLSLILFQTSTLFAKTWSILPIRTINIDNSAVRNGPILFKNRRRNAFELSSALHLYLKVLGKGSIVEPSYVESAFKKFRLNPLSKITKSDLNKIARYLDCDQLLLPKLIKSGNQFQLESKVYYATSNRVSDIIVTRHNNLWILLSKHILRRFQNLKVPDVLFPRATRPLLLILDASGSTYYDIKEIRKVVARADIRYSAACAVSGDGRLSFTKLGVHPRGIDYFLKKLRPSRGGNKLKSFYKAIECANRLNPYKGHREDRPKVVMLVSSVPNRRSAPRTESLLRKLASRSSILILGNDALSEEMISYWRNLANSLSQTGDITYQNISYRQRLGFSSGDTWFVFKKGSRIFQGLNKQTRKANKGTLVPAKYRAKFNANGIAKTHNLMNQLNIVDRGQIDRLLLKPILRFISGGKNKADRSERRARVLLEVGRRPVWISLPGKALFNARGEKIIEKGESYHFLLNLESPKLGETLTNTPSFGIVLLNNHIISRLLQLNLNSYLKNNKRFIGQSIGATSLYIVFGRVKYIRFETKDAFE